MRTTFATIVFLVSLSPMANSQSFWTGDSTVFSLSGNGVLYFQGGIKLNGDVRNAGTFVVDQDLDFVDNDTIGNIRLNSSIDQIINGDTLVLRDLTINKTASVALNTNSLVVLGYTDLTSGTILSDSIGKMIIGGGVNEVGGGFVQGAVVQVTQPGTTVIPVGIRGFKNYLTLQQTTTGSFFTAACIPPNPNNLVPEEEMVGVADEHIWVMAALGDSITTEVKAEYEGVDLNNFTISNPINSDQYEAALAYRTSSDSTFLALATNENTYRTSDDQSQGLIETTETITIRRQPLRIGVAKIPVLSGPVLYIPNSFAPEGQYEENRTFRPFFSGPEITRISIRIYNSSNIEVYSFDTTGSALEPALSGWDGVLNTGTEAPRGIYFYTVQVEAGGILYDEAGSVLLVRL